MLTLLGAAGAVCVDVPITWGVVQHLSARLLAVRVPEEVANQRRRRLRETVSAMVSPLRLSVWPGATGLW